jgi:hypothetical protein
MSKLTTAPVATERASPPPCVPVPRTSDGAAIVPMYTRHTLGAIEAERDRRGRSHGGRALRHVARSAASHPRIAAAIAACASSATQWRGDEERWSDDGGWFDREAVGRLQIADRKMKRCNS